MTSDPNFFRTKVPGFFARIPSSLPATKNVDFSRYFSFDLVVDILLLYFSFWTGGFSAWCSISPGSNEKKPASLMFRPFTVCQVVASDSGRIVILEYDGTKNMSNSQQWMDGVGVDGWFW